MEPTYIADDLVHLEAEQWNTNDEKTAENGEVKQRSESKLRSDMDYIAMMSGIEL